jgi:hypothetical protein
MSENFRTRLHDQWNLRALTHSQTEGTELEHGQPREQGHYGFMLTDLYLLPLLSGQNVDMSKGKLSLAPKFQAPYTVPVLISMCEAQLSAIPSSTTAGKTAPSGEKYTLLVGFGSLTLPVNGLTVSDCTYPHPVQLAAGQSVTWSCQTFEP